MTRVVKKEKSKNKKLKRILIIIAIVIIIAVIAFIVFNKIRGNKEDFENNVAVQAVSILTGASNTQENRFAGVVVSQKTVKLQKEANRTIKKVYVEVGQAVKTGDKLFEYSTDDVSAKIEQENLEVEKLQNSITNSQKQIDTMNAEKAANPGGDFSSYNLEIQTYENEIKQTQYNIKLKQSEIANLKKSLQNVVIKSEIDGIVQSINDPENSNGNETIDYGSGSSQDNSYMTIMQTGQYRIKGTVNEQNMFSIMPGERVLIHSRVDENVVWTGTIENIDTSNPESNSNQYGYMVGGDDSNKSSKYPFYITLDSMDGLMMGQHVYIEKDIGQEEKKEGLWLSSYYIVEENGESFVWAANKKDKLEKRKIKIGEKDEELGEYQILEGLTNEDYIAIPQEGLEEGKSVDKYDTMEMPMPDINIDNSMIEGSDMMDNMPTEEGVILDEGAVPDATVTPDATAVPETLPQTSSDAPVAK